MRKFYVFIAVLVFALILTGCKREAEVVDSSDSENNSTSEQTNVKKLEADKYCEGKTGQKACPAKGEEIVVMETNYGTVKMKLFTKEAPKTTANFKKLVGEKFYDGLTFHRVIIDFMIQGGDPEGSGAGGPDYTIPAEFNDSLKHLAGTVATARTGDAVNPTKASSGSQFYIVHTDTSANFLDGEYTIFGQVIEGQNIVNEIAQVETGLNDKPVTPVVIEKAFVEKY